MSGLMQAIDEMIAGGYAFGLVSKDGKEHALRPHWDDSDLWATACKPREHHRTLAMYSVDTAPTGGRRGLCLQPACNRERKRWLKVNEGSKR